jgi:hypothetical protein
VATLLAGEVVGEISFVDSRPPLAYLYQSARRGPRRGSGRKGFCQFARAFPTGKSSSAF